MIRQRIYEQQTIYGSNDVLSRAIWSVLDVAELLLLVRFLVLFFGFSGRVPVVQFIASLTYPLIAPFQGIIASTNVLGFTIEWTTLIAMLGYALLAYIIWELVRAIAAPYSEAA